MHLPENNSDFKTVARNLDCYLYTVKLISNEKEHLPDTGPSLYTDSV